MHVDNSVTLYQAHILKDAEFITEAQISTRLNGTDRKPNKLALFFKLWGSSIIIYVQVDTTLVANMW